MSKYKYDEGYVRTLLDKLPGKIEDKVKAFAEVHEAKIDTSQFNQGSYRSPDLVSILTEAVNKKDELAKVPMNEKSLESRVKKEVKVSNLLAAYETGKELAGYIPRAGRNIIYGMLPGKIQERLAKKHAENEINYTISNVIFEATAGIALFAGGIAVNSPAIGLPASLLIIYDLFRLLSAKLDNYSSGSALLNIPYYSVKLPYLGIKSILTGLKNKFNSKKLKLESEKKKKLELEAAELPQLPIKNILETNESSGSK